MSALASPILRAPATNGAACPDWYPPVPCATQVYDPWLNAVLPTGAWSRFPENILVGVGMMGPDEAQFVLEQCNTLNRPISPKAVAFLKKEILDGMFLINGETIIFSNRRKLMNGQHRCVSIRDTGKTVKVMVVVGVDPVAFDTMDQGKRRILADVLSVAAMPNPKYLAPVANLLYAYTQHGHLGRAGGGHLAMSNRFAKEFLEKYPGIAASIGPRPTNALQHLFGGSALIGALRYLFGLRHPKLAERYFHHIEKCNIPDVNVHPEWAGVLMLRQRLEQFRVGRKSTAKEKKAEGDEAGGKMQATFAHPAFVAALAIKAWNALVTKTKLGSLRYDVKKEKFPTIVGLNYPNKDGKWQAE